MSQPSPAAAAPAPAAEAEVGGKRPRDESEAQSAAAASPASKSDKEAPGDAGPGKRPPKRKKKKVGPSAEMKQFLYEFGQFQKHSNAAEFHAWYLEHKEKVVTQPRMIAPSVRLLAEVPDKEEALALFALAKERPNLLTEPLFTNIVRMYVMDGDTQSAFAIIKEMRAAGIEPRLRLFRSVLEAHKTVIKSWAAAERHLALYNDMKSTLLGMPIPMYPDEMAYAHALEGFCLVAEELPEEKAKAIQAFEEILEDFLDDILQPTEASLSVIKRRFALEPGVWSVEEGCAIDDASCQCSHCKAKLLAIEPSDSAREALLEQADNFPSSMTDGRKAKVDASWAGLKSKLATWASEADPAKRITCVVDGANIAYYKQNYKGGWSFPNIEAVIKHLESQGHVWLLFVHESHFGKRDVKTLEDLQIIERWKATGRLWIVPHGANDDWFWLYAAVYLGNGVQVISNDFMRDHHYEMLSQRFFQRWRDRRQSFFNFFRVGNEPISDIEIFPPAPYSKRAQRAEDRSSYHFPVSDAPVESTDLSKITREAGDSKARAGVVRKKEDELPNQAPLKWLCVSRVK